MYRLGSTKKKKKKKKMSCIIFNVEPVKRKKYMTMHFAFYHKQILHALFFFIVL